MVTAIDQLVENVQRVRESVAAAARRAGRAPEDVGIVAVAKAFPAERVAAAYRAGLRQFGENRVQEAAEKIPQLPFDCEWHLVGHLQSNKARRALELFHVLQSVHSLELAERLSGIAGKLGLTARLLLQVNVAATPTQSGLAPDRVVDTAAAAAHLPHVRWEGLMAIAPEVTDPEAVRPYFARLAALRSQVAASVPQHDWAHLSMGMTNDYTVAIEEGATLVRIGRAIFGERPATG